MPGLDSHRIVIVLGAERRGFCTACGSRWLNEADQARHVVRLPRSRPEQEPAHNPPA